MRPGCAQVRRDRGEIETMEDPMIRDKNQLFRLPVVAITFVLVLGALSMIWPGIIALFFGVLLLLQSCCVEQEILVLSWAEVSHVPMASVSFRRPGLASLLP